jgi:hypothetical protein
MSNCEESEFDSLDSWGHKFNAHTHCWPSEDTKLSRTFWWIPGLRWEQGSLR